ncbi:MAG: hypothetical protein OSJ43_11495 [Oscillospiraceae bacterium]|nr:hypothetical protein [Oscillospiraceae bacterium]
MLYTSYFAKINKLPPNVLPISICGKAPDWYKGIQYKKLAPKYGFFMEWKKTHNNEYYIEHFNTEVLSHLSPSKVVNELQQLLPVEVEEQATNIWENIDWHIALICYEKPSDFCHRHLVAKWLTDNGYKCEEWRD